MGTSHGSTLLYIPSNFHNADLVEICNPLTLLASGTCYVEDMNFLAFGKSTDVNFRSLQSIYKWRLDLAMRHGASFAPTKYNLVHFTKARTKHISTCPLVLLTSPLHPSHSARILGVILDKKLSWQPHLQPITSKLVTQTNVLSRLMALA
jgi:hypothetical protein